MLVKYGDLMYELKSLISNSDTIFDDNKLDEVLTLATKAN